jgi:N-acyl-D-amino-acid deacylase
MKNKTLLYLSFFLLFQACQTPIEYDVLITNALIVDGSGKAPIEGAIGINADTIAAVGDLGDAVGKTEVDAQGKAVAPGFINMLSHAQGSLPEDPRAMSDVKQGVTLEVMGEGRSLGPVRPELLADTSRKATWTDLAEFLQQLEDKGLGVNVASYVNATALRIHQIGFEDRAPTPEELETMKSLAREAMEEGALGIGTALIYAPAFYAKTDELIELCKVAGEYNGGYISHMRSEGNKFLEAIDEVIRIATEADVSAEIYHLKAAGKSNWYKMDLAIQKIDSARQAGIDIAANMYNYVAGATGLDAAMPPWVQEGGYSEWAKRLQDPMIRAKVAVEMKTDAQDWENLYAAAGSADKLILVGFRNDSLKKYTGKTLAEVSERWGKSPEETAMDLVVEDGSRVGTVYFLMSEENVKKQIQLPYISFGSDAGAIAPEGDFLQYNPHPRTYGNFARLLGKYVREEQVIPLEEAIHKLTYLSAQKIKIKKRGLLQPGYYADVVIFDPETIQDHATFEEPHQYSTGVNHVWVNGVQVLQDGEHTGQFPGRFVKGPGYQK